MTTLHEAGDGVLAQLELTADQPAAPAPLGWQHINLTGDHLWSGNAGLSPDAFRPLRDVRAAHRIASAA